MGVVYALKGDREKARSYFEKATKVKPDDKKAWYDLGVTYFTDKNYEKAAECFRKAHELDADFYEALYNLVSALCMKGDQDFEKYYQILYEKDKRRAEMLKKACEREKSGKRFRLW